MGGTWNNHFQFLNDTTKALAGAAVDVAMGMRPDPRTIHSLNAKLLQEHARVLRGADLDRANRTITHLEERANGRLHAWR